MEQHYVPQIIRWLLVAWLMSVLLSAQAQTTQPPIRQWQRVIDGGDLSQTSTVRAVKAGTGGYGVLAGKNLVLLSATGDLLWTQPVPGSYADSATSRVSIQQTIALAPSRDGGFVVLAQDIRNRYYVSKLDSAGNSAWTKTVERADAGPSVRVTENALIAAPDGGFLVVGSYSDNLSYLTMTKLSSEGYIVGQWRVNFSASSQSATLLTRQIVPLSNGGYLLVGQATGSTATDSKGFAIQIDGQYKVVWQQVYSTLNGIQDVIVNPKTEGTYIAIGSGMGGNGQAITLAPNKTGDGAVLYSIPGGSAVVSLVGDGSGNVTVLDATTSNNGDFRLTNGALPTTFRWTKTFGGSGADVPTALLATDDGGYLAVGTTTSTDGDVTGKSTNSLAAWVIKLGNSPQATTLRLLPPVYECQTGIIRFQTRGGDGSPITYNAPGISLANSTDTVGTVEPGLRKDPSVLVIQATQRGQTVRYTFDLGAYCRATQSTPASADSLKLIAPTYNCETGALMFHATGGNGSPIEYTAAGVTDWTINPSQVVPPAVRTDPDAQPLTLMARQNGQVVTYIFNLKAACGRARLGVTEPTTSLTVTVLGNPARETALINITGAGGQSVRLQLVDSRGGLVEQRIIERADALERQTFDIRQQPVGTLLLHTTVNGQTQTVKVLKQ